MKQPHMLDLQDLAYVEQILQVSPQQVKKTIGAIPILPTIC